MGHTQETAEYRQYQVRWLGLTPEDDTFHDSKDVPCKLVVPYFRMQKITLPVKDNLHFEARCA